MADMGEYIADKYTTMVKAITEDLGHTADKLALAQNILRALKNPDMLVNGRSLTLDIIQVMEDGSIRVLPPLPALTCIQESKDVGREVFINQNGKKESKKPEAITVQEVEASNDPR
jgi:hypothetical protein